MTAARSKRGRRCPVPPSTPPRGSGQRRGRMGIESHAVSRRGSALDGQHIPVRNGAACVAIALRPPMTRPTEFVPLLRQRTRRPRSRVRTSPATPFGWRTIGFAKRLRARLTRTAHSPRDDDIPHPATFDARPDRPSRRQPRWSPVGPRTTEWKWGLRTHRHPEHVGSLSRVRGSNSPPHDYKSSALPTELTRRGRPG